MEKKFSKFSVPLGLLDAECKEQGVSLLIALMAGNNEAQRFYRHVDNASIHDMGIWMNID